MVEPELPLIVLAGPTASGKSGLALRLAEHFDAEIISCDSVAVYRDMEIGTAKPSRADRARIPHHLIDVVPPTEPFTAGDFARHAREALEAIRSRNRLPIIAGGTGLYLRALLDGLFPAPPQQPALRERLRTRTSPHLHRVLTRLDPAAAALIHPNDLPKLVRAIEVSLAARQPLTEQWQKGRDALTGYRILRLGLQPPRPALYARINQRAARMFSSENEGGLIEETRNLIGKYGPQRPFTSLGYAEATAVLEGKLTPPEAIALAQQGHRNYAKRQATWFRKEPAFHWLPSFGDDPATYTEALSLMHQHLERKPPPEAAP
ncbi:tRNA (adenosine(37)-N6)-dimethylallyltransferase MiaA [Granulicella sibirica]|uniref:tRNA (adenosine(37)-N6)-dimethylallyltransferase MiaA n=1 Tax=Granulicella sibirica TaxID=2479048 RepID=UPI0010090FAB|nr:tRNA (adenosine(37)-N6)-dimethylallyltransferase MiaA [Granulicella sibirica]